MQTTSKSNVKYRKERAEMDGRRMKGMLKRQKEKNCGTAGKWERSAKSPAQCREEGICG